jgi:hypothetical protein
MTAAASAQSRKSRVRPPRIARTWNHSASVPKSMNSAYMRASSAYQTVNGATVASAAAASPVRRS